MRPSSFFPLPCLLLGACVSLVLPTPVVGDMLCVDPGHGGDNAKFITYSSN
jgi:hypothetical protein